MGDRECIGHATDFIWGQQVKLLFLDFDGVLHDVSAVEIEHVGHGMQFSGSRLFSRLHLLEELLAHCPDVSVVVSSSWQHHCSLADLRILLGAAGDRVIGTTGSSGAHPSDSRYEQCRVAAEVLSASVWVMVDDQPSLVWGDCVPTRDEMARTIFCDPVLGLTPMIVDSLVRKLS
jgi:hypothetical protein